MIDSTTMLLIHIGLSFMSLALGFVAVRELSAPKPTLGTELFLITGILTTLTGFFLPFETITPPVMVGIISSIVFLLMLLARFAFQFKGFWRVVYAVGMVISTYFLVFVTVVQAFLKVPPMHALAPTGSEPPFAIAQVIVLIAFIAWGRSAVKSFRPNQK